MFLYTMSVHVVMSLRHRLEPHGPYISPSTVIANLTKTGCSYTIFYTCNTCTRARTVVPQTVSSGLRGGGVMEVKEPYTVISPEKGYR